MDRPRRAKQGRTKYARGSTVARQGTRAVCTADFQVCTNSAPYAFPETLELPGFISRVAASLDLASRDLLRFGHVSGEPLGGEVGDLVESAGLFEKMGGVGDGFDSLFAGQLVVGVLV